MADPAARVAEILRVPPNRLPAFRELYEALAEANSGRAPARSKLQKYEEILSGARSQAEVLEFAQGHDAELGTLCAAAGVRRELVTQRLIFVAVYGERLGLEDALRVVREELQARADALQTHRPPFTVRHGRFDDRHEVIRRASYPYRPACSAQHGDETLDCLSAEGTLVGYLAVEEGNYLDDIAVVPSLHGVGVAKALVCVAAREAVDHGQRALSLDVRACNLPARGLYKSLGFKEDKVGARARPATPAGGARVDSRSQPPAHHRRSTSPRSLTGMAGTG